MLKLYITVSVLGIFSLFLFGLSKCVLLVFRSNERRAKNILIVLGCLMIGALWGILSLDVRSVMKIFTYSVVIIGISSAFSIYRSR